MTGAQGLQGGPGTDGAQGPQGPQGNAGTGFSFKGAFDKAATYAAYDVVSFDGSSYVALSVIYPGEPAPDVNPSWSLIAQQGATGPAGSPGPIGPIGPVGPMPQGAALTTQSNVFAGSQTVNGSLILAGAGAGVQFGDGTSQTTAASGSSSGVPSGFMILSTSPVPPPG